MTPVPVIMVAIVSVCVQLFQPMHRNVLTRELRLLGETKIIAVSTKYICSLSQILVANANIVSFLFIK